MFWVLDGYWEVRAVIVRVLVSLGVLHLQTRCNINYTNLDGDDLRMLIQVFQHLGPVIVGLLFHRADLRCIQVVRLLPEEALADHDGWVGIIY